MIKIVYFYKETKSHSDKTTAVFFSHPSHPTQDRSLDAELKVPACQGQWSASGS